MMKKIRVSRQHGDRLSIIWFRENIRSETSLQRNALKFNKGVKTAHFFASTEQPHCGSLFGKVPPPSQPSAVPRHTVGDRDRSRNGARTLTRKEYNEVSCAHDQTFVNTSSRTALWPLRHNKCGPRRKRAPRVGERHRRCRRRRRRCSWSLPRSGFL